MWGALVSLIYLVHGGMVWWADPAHWHWGALELGLALLFMVSGSYFIRWRAESATTS